jgi:hypothetical protein
VTPESEKAESAIFVTERGRLMSFRSQQSPKTPCGIFVRCEGASNVRDVNLRHTEKAKAPRVETEEETVKDSKME